MRARPAGAAKSEQTPARPVGKAVQVGFVGKGVTFTGAALWRWQQSPLDRRGRERS